MLNVCSAERESGEGLHANKKLLHYGAIIFASCRMLKSERFCVQMQNNERCGVQMLNSECEMRNAGCLLCGAGEREGLYANKSVPS